MRGVWWRGRDKTPAEGDEGAPARPQLIGFYRHPFARCRSHWKYEQALCHRPRMEYHSGYCHGYFLPRFGAFNRSSTHVAFAEQYCREHTSRSLSAENGIHGPPHRFALEKLHFFGITEHFLESLCLFLYQVGRFRRDLCTCSGSARPLEIRRELQRQDPAEAELQRQGAAGVPALELSDEQLHGLNNGDLAMYHVLLHTLKQRVHLLEKTVNATIWACGKLDRQRGTS